MEKKKVFEFKMLRKWLMIKLRDSFTSNFSYLITGKGAYAKVRLYGGLSSAAKNTLEMPYMAMKPHENQGNTHLKQSRFIFIHIPSYVFKLKDMVVFLKQAIVF